MCLQTGTTGKSTIQFVRGIETDTLVDYRLVNDNDLFRLQFQQNQAQFGDSNSFLMDTSITKTLFYKDLQVSGNVGIVTTPHTTYKLNVNGELNLSAGSTFRIGGTSISAVNYWTNANTNESYFNLSGNLGIGTSAPVTKTHVQYATVDTRLTIEDKSLAIKDRPTTWVCPEDPYSS